MRYPLNFSFKIAAIASQIYARDADGQNLFYVKQKLFKLKENIEVYPDSNMQSLLYTIKADRVIDFSPQFTLFDQTNRALGSVKRNGKASIWKANYTVKVGNELELTVQETNPWVKVIDAFISEIPILGIISNYLFHPSYKIESTPGQSIATLHKIPAFFEGKYQLDSSSLESKSDEYQKIFAVLMMVVVLRERMRG